MTDSASKNSAKLNAQLNKSMVLMKDSVNISSQNHKRKYVTMNIETYSSSATNSPAVKSRKSRILKKSDKSFSDDSASSGIAQTNGNADDNAEKLSDVTSRELLSASVSSRPHILEELVQKETLSMENTLSKFSLEDMSDSGDIRIMDLPKLINPQELGQVIALKDKSKFRITDERYCIVAHKTNHNVTCVSNNEKKTSQYKTVNIKPAGALTIRKKLSGASEIKPIPIDFADTKDSIVRLSHKDKVKRAEIKLAAFFAEHNIAFSSANHLIPLLKNVCIDPEVVSNLSLARDKCTNVTRIIAKCGVEKIKNIQNCRFSILIDESTDVSDSKFNVCILVQYASPSTKKITTQLLDVLSIDATDCSANKIFEIFKTILAKNAIPLKNIIGIASDDVSVTIGCNNSFTSCLKLEMPGLVTLNCICHSSVLIANKACEKLPESCENLIRGIATYISDSAKRCTILDDFQQFFNVEKSNILKLSKTRWLVLHECIVRLLDNWEGLKSYFALAIIEDKLKSAELILDQLNDNFIKAYLLFLKYTLNFFNKFNALFQSRKILIHTLFKSSQQLIREIAQNFVILKALKNITDFDIDDESIRQDVKDIYVGPECESFVKTLPLECAREIKLNCLEFYVTAVREMLKRLPYKDIVFEQLQFLQPKIALYYEARIKFKDLTFIATRIGNIDITQLAYEWRILPSVYNDEEKIELASLEIDDMWKNILEFENFNGEKMFPHLELLVDAVLSFPHSNAEAERIFSTITNLKCFLLHKSL